ncbi:Hydroxyacylglutathione hydrolase GloB [Ralstonia condita]|jgi:hydroxyacylglutathione hydrolase|uniref:Hydroxyacylglutathione hydrolase n=1 Tax=Ralstonia condita TaxID=3058600 RepID=A0ABM9J1H8_9RALS|nr:hydroxyacylglutathione hydrolase [Ralstonia sp. LMG 7141]MDE2202733.1 hydroxyacylglutathione hydrolase [Burkholderiaceae bacterium]CAJ0779284.1 Hydroxyacylglutathione hydrolase GloB [Ralstonia sp. LMG 7141]
MVQGGVPLAVEAIAAFSDNYIWALHDGRVAAVVDPGDAQPVLRFLQERGLALGAIVITHHHGDHVGGVRELVAAYPERPDGTPLPVVGPADESIPCRTQAVREGDVVTLAHPAATFRVIDVPGHTKGHVAYVSELSGNDAPASLFCGDTLFATGCGRLFEGTPAQMRASLAKLAALAPDTRVYCAHEYTASNVRFARAVEPGNAPLAAWEDEVTALRAEGRATVPTTVGHERATNPFMRSDEPDVARAVARQAGIDAADPVAVFAALREWKNSFR